MTNINVTAHGKTGKVTAYLNAAHVISGPVIGGPSRCVAVANGAGSGDVERFDSGWKITKMYPTLITLNPVFESGAGC